MTDCKGIIAQGLIARYLLCDSRLDGCRSLCSALSSLILEVSAD
jgi:hypothetical protein